MEGQLLAPPKRLASLDAIDLLSSPGKRKKRDLPMRTLSGSAPPTQSTPETRAKTSCKEGGIESRQETRTSAKVAHTEYITLAALRNELHGFGDCLADKVTSKLRVSIDAISRCKASPYSFDGSLISRRREAGDSDTPRHSNKPRRSDASPDGPHDLVESGSSHPTEESSADIKLGQYGIDDFAYVNQQSKQVDRQVRVMNAMKKVRSRRGSMVGDIASMLNQWRKPKHTFDLTSTSWFHRERWSRLARTITSHSYFDLATALILIANSLYIGVQVDYQATHIDSDEPDYFVVVDCIFCFLFTAEIGLRLLAMGLTTFCRGEAKWWNWFDCAMVAFSLFDILWGVVPDKDNKQKKMDMLMTFKLLRLGRIARLIRLVRMIPELKSMVCLIQASMQAFAWTGVLFVILIYGYSIFFTMAANDIRRAHPSEDLSALNRYWGSIFASCIGLFSSFSGGNNWTDLTEALKLDDRFYYVNLIVFIAYISFVLLVMLNLVTGVFVEGAQQIIKDDKTNEFIKNTGKLFDRFDIDHSTSIHFTEFRQMCDDGAIKDFCADVGLRTEDLGKLFYLLDEDGSGEVSAVEFVRGMLQLRGTARASDLSMLRFDMKVYMKKLDESSARTSEEVLKIKSLLANGNVGKTSGRVVPHHQPLQEPNYEDGNGEKLFRATSVSIESGSDIVFVAPISVTSPLDAPPEVPRNKLSSAKKNKLMIAKRTLSALSLLDDEPVSQRGSWSRSLINEKE